MTSLGVPFLSQHIADHLWQSTLFAVGVWILTLALRDNGARVRYGLWLSASVKFLLPFTLLTNLGEFLRQARPVADLHVAQGIAARLPVITGYFVMGQVTPAAATHTWIPALLFYAWIAGALGIGIFRLRAWLRLTEVIRSGKPILLPGGVRAISTRAAIEPGVVGWARPVLLLPAGIDECLDTPQWDAVLAHELCHIRRRDNLTAALHMLTEALFWFHPLVWWIGARMLDERERACDEAVLAEGNTPRNYAEGIVNVCKRYARSPIPCVAGVAGSDLKKRIEDIFMNRASVRLSISKKALLAAAGALAVVSPVLVGMLSAGLGVVGLSTLAAQTAPTTAATTMPVRISGPEPEYTEQARAARWGGTVLLSVTIRRGRRAEGHSHRASARHGVGREGDRSREAMALPAHYEGGRRGAYDGNA